MSIFAGCCGLGDMGSLEPPAADAEKFSPILALDSYVKDWAYDYFKEDYETDSLRCIAKCKGFPKRKNVDIKIVWDRVIFTHNAPIDLAAEAKQKYGTKQQSASVEESSADSPLMKNGGGDEPPKDGYDPHNVMGDLYNESFAVKYHNTTTQPCKVTLTSNRMVKNSYEVDIHSSVQVGHTVQMSFKLGGDEAFGEVEGAYEFNKMLEQYKGEKSSKEMETTLTTECPVVVPANCSTVARFVTSYQNFKKTLLIASKFSGMLNVEIIEKKRHKNSYYRHLSIDVADVFNDLREAADSPLTKMLKIEGTRPNQVVTYTSSATFSSNYGVDQTVHIVDDPSDKRVAEEPAEE